MENIRDFKPRKSSFGKYLKFLVGAYALVGIVLLLNNKLILDFTLSIFYVLGIFVAVSISYSAITLDKKYGIAGVIAVVIYFGALIFSSPIINYKAHRSLIGDIEEVEFSSQIEHIDLKQLPTIDKDVADKLADKKLGEIPSLGSQVTVGDLNLQSVNGQLYYVAPLEHTSFFKWFNNREGTPGYIKVSATNENDVQLVTEVGGQDLKIKYLKSGYFLDYLDRAAYFKDMKAGHTDYTFELDDAGNPYWTITRYDNAVGVVEERAIGTLVIDAQTGESEVYDIENTPTWVDRIQPDEYIKGYIDKWGELVHGILNFSDKDKLKSTEGMNLIFNKDITYYYTGVTSVGNDEGLVGFTLTNTRTGETTLYKTSGATETASMKSAEGKVQQFNVLKKLC